MSSDPRPSEPGAGETPVEPVAGPDGASLWGGVGFWLACAVGGAWSAFLLSSYASGQVDLMLARDFVHYPLVAGLLLFVVVAHAVICGPQRLGESHGGPFEEVLSPQCNHAMTWVGSLVLLLPLGAAWWLGPDGFSYEAVARRGLDPTDSGIQGARAPQIDRRSLEIQFPPDAAGDRPMTLLHLVGASGDEEMRELLTGQGVVIEGQLAPWPANRGDGEHKLLLYQLLIACCAADMVPLTAELRTEAAPWEGEVEGEWARVRGALDFVRDEESGYWRPLVEVRESKSIEPPADQFMQR